MNWFDTLYYYAPYGVVAILVLWWILHLTLGRRPSSRFHVEPEYRRATDKAFEAAMRDDPEIAVYTYQVDDGAPFESRGRVWDPQERQFHQERARVKQLRLVK